MLEIALVNCSDELAQKISHALPHVNLCTARYECLSQIPSANGKKNFELIILHYSCECVDETLNQIIEQHLPHTTPAIAVISENHPEFSVPLLNLGIDRCLPESFDVSHFSAIVRALVRRKHGLISSVSQYGTLSFSHETKRVWITGKEVELTKREAQVLDILLRRVGQIISKTDFIEEMDPNKVELNASAVEVYIHRLRKKINNEHLPIRNIKRCGYFLRRFDPPTETNSFTPARFVFNSGAG